MERTVKAKVSARTRNLPVTGNRQPLVGFAVVNHPIYITRKLAISS